MKKSKAIILCTSLVFSLYSITLPLKLASAEMISIKSTKKDPWRDSHSTGRNLLKNYKKTSPLCQKLKMDYSNSTNLVCDNVEKELNSLGVFDNDIEELDDQTLENLNEGNDFSVSIIYADEQKDGTLSEMSMDEVDDLIAEEYSKELASAPKTGFWDWFQLEPAIASAKSASSTLLTSSSGKVKQILVISQNVTGGNVHVDYKVKWVEEPYYRDTDVIGISLLNMSPITSTWGGSYTYTIRDFMLTNGKIYKTPGSKSLKKEDTVSNTNGMATKVNLYSSRSKLDAVNASGSVIEKIIDEVIHIYFDCKIMGGNGNGSASGEYQHAKGKYVASPSISISGSGISVGISTSYAKYYSKVTNNPTVTFQFK